MPPQLLLVDQLAIGRDDDATGHVDAPRRDAQRLGVMGLDSVADQVHDEHGPADQIPARRGEGDEGFA